MAQHRPVRRVDEKAGVRDVEPVRFRLDTDEIAGAQPADDVVVDELSRDMDGLNGPPLAEHRRIILIFVSPIQVPP